MNISKSIFLVIGLILNGYSSSAQISATKNSIQLGVKGDFGNSYFYNDAGDISYKISIPCDTSKKEIDNIYAHCDLSVLIASKPPSPLSLTFSKDLNHAKLIVTDSTNTVILTKSVLGIEAVLEISELALGRYQLQIITAPK
jgi:hypothetical protein